MAFSYRQVRYRYLSGSPEAVEQFLRRSLDWRQSSTASVAAWRPPTDVCETPDRLVVRIEVAGLREEDVDVCLYDDALVVTGRREPPSDCTRYHVAGIPTGDFRCEIYLPGPIDHQAVTAQYDAGFLVITLPRPKRDGKEAG